MHGTMVASGAGRTVRSPGGAMARGAPAPHQPWQDCYTAPYERPGSCRGWGRKTKGAGRRIQSGGSDH
jgi:hypothetical protein